MINWNNNIVEKYAPKSVQRFSDLIPGETYYSNSRGVIKFVRMRPYYFVSDRNNPEKHDGNYIEYINESGQTAIMCPEDHNMNGHNYNPWMVFANEEDYLAYVAEINPTIWYSKEEDRFYNDYQDIIYWKDEV